jgi:outer membrane protein assembly factor BamB
MILPFGKSWLLSFAVLVGANGWAAEEQATQIVQTAGVKGGLIVQLGCGDGKLTAALYAGDRYLVHGLDSNAENVEQARKYIQSLGLYGKVSVEHWTGEQLPYVDNLANLVVAENLGETPMTEVMRVLAPLGVACIKSGSQWTQTVKPWPRDIDEWTHFLHGPDNNAVAHDSLVGPPKHVQWRAGPLYCRSHEIDSSISAMVSARGRMFYILDEGPTGVLDERFPEQWALVARDAFNGTFLWKRPVPDWGWPEWKKEQMTGRVGILGGQRLNLPPTLTRRLVVDGEHVYVTLGFHAPVTEIDAAGGATARVYAGTENADEILCSQRVLVVCVRRLPSGEPKGPTEDSILAVDAGTGQVLWRKDALNVPRLSLAVDAGRVIFENHSDIVCSDLKTGEQFWRVPDEANKGGTREGGGGWLAGVSETLVIHNGVVLVLGDDLVAYSLEDGKLLWKSAGSKGAGGVGSPPDLFVAAGLVWPGARLQGHDLLTGEVKQEVDILHLLSEDHHPRCYRSKATDTYLIFPKRGVEFVDLQGATGHMRHDWLRGPCRYGILPCNGLLYAAPHQCNCYPGVKLTGFNALSAARMPVIGGRPLETRLERGPASGSDWPSYRHDFARSGFVKSTVPADAASLWQTKLGGKLSPPVVADGRLLVASVETHRIYCLDAQDGTSLWDFTAGARIDGPPTVYKGLALFGSADGWVYCVRVADGKLAWRYRAAPEERRVTAFGELESAWPVHGSVLIQNDIAYVAAGRSTFLDGGIQLCALEPFSGKLLHEKRLEGPYPDITEGGSTAWNMDGATSDVLVGDGTFVYLRQVKLDGNLVEQPTPLVSSVTLHSGGGAKDVGLHLYSTSELLDDASFNRTFWLYSSQWAGRCKKLPEGAGQLLVFDSTTTYGVRYYTLGNDRPMYFPATDCIRLFAVEHHGLPVEQPATSRRGKRKAAEASESERWSITIPVRVRAMALADETLFIAGSPDVLDPRDPLAALEGREGSVLWAVSTVDGRKVAERQLPAMPVFDGMAAAQGRLYQSMTDGAVISLGAQQ